MKKLRTIVVAALVACACFSASAPASAGQGPVTGQVSPDANDIDTVDELLSAFEKMPGLKAEFREEKHMSLLAAPLVNEGTLHFSQGKLARHTVKPAKSSLVIADGRLSFGDDAGSDHIDLSRNPVVKLFVDSFVEILAGDRAALDKMYAMKMTRGPQGAGWVLTLRPKLDPMKGAIDRLVLEGKGIDLARMRVVERGGDETVTTFRNVDSHHRYSKAETASTFVVR